MQSEMRKETLTREQIKVDIKKLYFTYIKKLFSLFILTESLPLIGLSVIHSKPNAVLGIKVMLLLMLLILFVIGFDIYKQFKLVYMINKNKFDIVIDKLIYTEDKETYSSISTMGRLLNKPHRLHFSSYNNYEIPYGKNYQWSQMYSMDASGVYNYSVIGDEFYLVIINNKIAIAYNTKLFELKD